MRVNSGKYRGIYLNTISGRTTRPTLQKTKEAIFSMLYQEVEGAVVLDLFGGSGSLGIEALSNGAEFVTFVERDNKAYRMIEDNLKKLKGASNYEVLKSDYQAFLERTNKQYDLIFLDPPFKLEIMNDLLKTLIDKEIISEKGIIVCEVPIKQPVLDQYQDYYLYKDKKYGQSAVKMYRRNQ